MENRNSYTIVGMFFLLCVTAFVGFIWWMSGDSGKLEYKNYYIYTKELPAGLKEGSAVKFIGVPAGSVGGINFVKDADALIEITLKIRDDLPIKKDSVANTEFQIISGVAGINISRGTQDFSKDDKPVLKLEDSLLSKVKDDVQSMGEKIYGTLERVDRLLSEKNAQNLESIVANLQNFSAQIANERNAKNLSEILNNLNALSAKLNGLNVKQTGENLNALLKDADTLIASINGAIGGFNGLQKSVRDRVEGGEFDLRASLNPMILEATNLLSDFQKTLRGFRAALDRLEDNPYEFFFKEPVQGADKKGR